MKQRAVTVEGIRFEPHWYWGYTGELNGKRVIVRQARDRDWIVRESSIFFPLEWLGKTIGGGSTMRAAVRMAKERV